MVTVFFNLMRKLLFLFLLIFPFITSFAQEAAPTTVKIVAVGDIMMGTDYPRNRLPANDGKDLMKDVESILKLGDITFGNLEGTFLNGGEPEKKCKDTTKCYIFRTPTKYANNLSGSGFNLISLANNHAFDFGSIGIDTTMKLLDERNIKHSGKLGSKAIWEEDGLKFGFIAYAPNDGCNQLLNLSTMRSSIKALNEYCDIVIVSFHGGAEGEDAMHVADSMEIFYKEKRGNVIQFAHNAIDAGADIVIGHGPHVPRAIEIYNDRLIAYSLGNFCTYEGFSVSGAKGIAPILYAELKTNGEFARGKIYSAVQKRPKGPVPDKNNQALKLIKKLTEEDFIDSKILFLEDGTFFNSNIKSPRIRKNYKKPQASFLIK